MLKKNNHPSLWLVLSAIGALSAPPVATAGSADDLAEGGRLYDKWWAEYGLRAPKETHPAYPASGKKSGSDTWRCKECHGWDYKGKDGAYSKGGHYTGITGLRGMVGAEPGEVVTVLKNAKHRYDQVMLEPALARIARFVVAGQLDTDQWVDAKTKRVMGDAVKGQVLFEDKCARCHGDDGRNLNFKTDDDPEYVGTVATNNPWELLHKIRNGQPGSRMPMGPGMMGRWRPNEAMPNFRKLSENEQAAIAAYAQTLPDK